MRTGVLGTGSVGRALAGRLAELGHDVMLGTRDVGGLMRRPAGPRDSESFAEWLDRTPQVSVGTFSQAASHGETLFSCTFGEGSLDALASTDDRQAGSTSSTSGTSRRPGGWRPICCSGSG